MNPRGFDQAENGFMENSAVEEVESPTFLDLLNPPRV